MKTEKQFDPTQPPPFPIGASAGEKNGGLSDTQMDALKFTFADHLRVKGELEAAQRDIARLREAVAEALIQIETLRSWNNHLESQVESAIAKRDQAVADRAVYETFFAGIMAQMREFKIPAVPLIRETKHAAQTE